ncbi:DUF1289 domain-containing protein [Rhodanobacter denitrificans]|uniref:Putative Fe-S protein n=1 Tax=Rhodanobacter denitrificans TaxID=666685 RepID=M4NDN9_9GAMM|nr:MULTISPECIES: DUF1289 domain-containing protein [Rhodanobacter]OZB73271.1 MAG: DUF1289 domain-containing protein [Xanthomonadales bacterium 13-68-4]AGG88885.1 putative Fe-S protein [Rhodanobacter denitrificans]MBQ4853669.1 DUF1289 domain-containing protein [Rhodanobacter sp. B2A1Ga4]UJJ49419.1 DUF1289 domain-containing protein [Rhodanobacter denitrificans]UJJ60460.1 DUF1289 domain-containing protein [Rhodanobacter denitrificans]
MALASPCGDVCRFNRKADVCVGCFRTTTEIRQWRKLTDYRRREILADLARRAHKLKGGR